MSEPILIRCDATESTGLGHLSRCIALAEAFREIGQEARFLGNYGKRGMEMLRGAALDPAAESPSTRCRGSVIDSYTIGSPEVLSLPAPRVWIDDFAQRDSYHAIGILNFTIAAPEFHYPAEIHQRWLGPDYFLTRASLRELRTSRATEAGDAILVCIGGHDRSGLGRRVVDALLEVPSGPRRIRWIDPSCSKRCLDQHRDREVEAIPFSPDPAENFRGARLAITGGGLAKYESAYLGLPSVAINQTQEQAAESHRFAEAGFCVDLGHQEELNAGALRSALADILSSSARLQEISQHCLDHFPADATRNAANSILNAFLEDETT